MLEILRNWIEWGRGAEEAVHDALLWALTLT